MTNHVTTSKRKTSQQQNATKKRTVNKTKSQQKRQTTAPTEKQILEQISTEFKQPIPQSKLIKLQIKQIITQEKNTQINLIAILMGLMIFIVITATQDTREIVPITTLCTAIAQTIATLLTTIWFAIMAREWDKNFIKQMSISVRRTKPSLFRTHAEYLESATYTSTFMCIISWFTHMLITALTMSTNCANTIAIKIFVAIYVAVFWRSIGEAINTTHIAIVLTKVNTVFKIENIKNEMPSTKNKKTQSKLNKI